jgi:hypothetical protein
MELDGGVNTIHTNLLVRMNHLMKTLLRLLCVLVKNYMVLIIEMMMNFGLLKCRLCNCQTACCFCCCNRGGCWLQATVLCKSCDIMGRPGVKRSSPGAFPESKFL